MNATDPLLTAEQQRQELIAYIRRVSDVAGELDSSRTDELEHLAGRVASDLFRVMVVGDFKRGKSTLLNALLGEDVLPSSASPMTAVVTEVRFSEEPEVRLWPVDTEADYQSVPFEELSDRIKINNTNPEETSPFRLAEVGWPIELCRNGVVVIDSPGLNEHPVRQMVTLDYLRHADAVVFVMDATAPVSLGEQAFLDRHLASHDLFFVVNKINHVDEDERDEVRQNTVHKIQLSRPQRESSVFFVNAKAGVKARLADDEVRWASSGMAAFESGLSDYLVAERHRAKVLVPARDAKGIVRDLRQRIPEQVALLEADANELEQRYQSAQRPLDDLSRHASQLERSLAGRFDDLGSHVHSEVRSFLTLLANSAPELVTDLTTEQSISLVPWKVKSAAEAYATDLATMAASAASERFDSWSTDELAPELNRRLAEVSEEFDGRLHDYVEEVHDVREALTGVHAAIEDRPKPFTSILNDFTGGGVGNLEGMNAGTGVSVILKQVMVAIGVSMVWALTPWTIVPAMVAFVVAAALHGGTEEKIGNRIRSKVADEVANEIRRGAHDHADAAAAAFLAELDPVKDAVSRRVQGETEELRAQVEAALADKRAGADRVVERRRALDELMRRLDDVDRDLDDLVNDVALT